MAASHTLQNLYPFSKVTLLPFTIAQVPFLFLLFKSTLITTLLSKPLLEVDPVLLVFHFKTFFACQIPCNRPLWMNRSNDYSDEGEDKGSSFFCVLVLHSIAFLQLLPYILPFRVWQIAAISENF